MKKDKLLEEYKEMKVSNPQEFVGGLQALVPYDTHYQTKKSCYSESGAWSEDTIEDVATDYYNDEFITDPSILK